MHGQLLPSDQPVWKHSCRKLEGATSSQNRRRGPNFRDAIIVNCLLELIRSVHAVERGCCIEPAKSSHVGPATVMLCQQALGGVDISVDGHPAIRFLVVSLQEIRGAARQRHLRPAKALRSLHNSDETREREVEASNSQRKPPRCSATPGWARAAGTSWTRQWRTPRPRKIVKNPFDMVSFVRHHAVTSVLV